MSTTIDDVAKLAGVSTATVSRYLNNSPYIAPKSREKVENAMKKLNYLPSFVARSLAGANTSIIALVVDSGNTEKYGNDFFLKIQYGIEAELGKQGYYLLIINVDKGSGSKDSIKKLVLERRVDGIILPNELVEDDMLQLFSTEGLPFLIIGRNSDQSLSWIDINNEMGGYLAASHLLDTGCRRIAFLTSSFDKQFVQERFAGYKRALSEYGAAFDGSLIVSGCVSDRDGERAAALLLGRSGADAFLCTDNIVGFGVLRTLEKCGTAVPEQKQVLSFDNSIITELSSPRMSVVDIDVFLLGERAAKMLLSHISKEDSRQKTELLSVSLIIKESSR